MAAPKGNQFWKARTKHGRDRVIKSPEILAAAADEYFQFCLDNPLIIVDYRGKPLERIEIPKPKPFQKGELARFCGLTEWRDVKSLKELSKDFSQIVTHIEDTIANQKYQYAVIGEFNSNIVARDLGLKDKVENEHSGSVNTKISFKE